MEFDRNWYEIVGEALPLLGKKFLNDGVEWYFTGIVFGDDDYYYLMTSGERYTLLSCVGTIEQHGFKLVEE